MIKLQNKADSSLDIPAACVRHNFNFHVYPNPLLYTHYKAGFNYAVLRKHKHIWVWHATSPKGASKTRQAPSLQLLPEAQYEGEKKIYTFSRRKKKKKKYPRVGPLFKENSKCLALLQEENKCTSGLSHLAKDVIIAQLSLGITCECTDIGNARCPSKYFLPVTWETKRLPDAGFQHQRREEVFSW